MTISYGLPVDFAIANADIDDRQVLPLLCERGRYPVVLADKGYTSETLKHDVFENYNVRLYATYRRRNKRIVVFGQYTRNTTIRQALIRISRLQSGCALR